MIFYIDKQDKRTNYIAKCLKKKKLQILSVLEMQNATKGDVLVFPPSKKWSEPEVHNLPCNITLFCGNCNFNEILKQKNIKHINFLSEEHFSVQNARLTAEGVLALLIENTKKSIFEQNILLFGAGRITKATAILLLKLGVRFSIVTFNEAEFDNCFYFSNKNYLGFDFVKDIKNFDVFINTRPIKFIDESIIKKIKKESLFIETASIDCLDKTLAKNFCYLPAPALPSRFCFESASNLMLDKILGELNLW